METTTIKVGEKEFVLNVGSNLTVGTMRKIYPIIKSKSDNEIEMVIEILKALSSDSNIENVVNSMSIEEFGELAEKVSALIGQESQKKK